MKKISVLALLLSFTIQAQNHKEACTLFSKINTVLQQRHFKPKPVDDSLSVYVFETVMDALDENHTLFLKAEYDKVAVHKYKIDDYIKNEDCTFFTDFIDIYKTALERRKAFVNELAAQPLPYNTKDTIHYSKDAFPYHSDPAKIRNYLRKKLTLDILEDIARQSKDRDSLKTHLTTIGKTTHDKVFAAYLCRIDSELSPAQGIDNTIYNLFFSTFCSWFDPHSTYFNYNEKQSFVSSISTENYSLGIYVSQNDKDEVIVEDVVPGGPAYRSGKVDKGDQIMKLSANNENYEVSCASTETISNIVFSDSYKDVELTLRKKDGTVYTVKLKKEIMKAEDHSVYSYIVGDEVPVGYIKVPSFYTAYDSDSNQGCADDVAKEITKLKKDNVKGLIIDLQFNGGGSMDEVIRMAGMFINFGPVGVVTDKEKEFDIIKDYNRGTLYNGPMIVLVNGFSASASEFFAGVMQDYNRALIVGSTTVGKATMQTILPLEEKKDAEDFVKVTIDKFYRVTGRSSQYTGIIPDVPLPSFFDNLLPRESSSPTALKNDSLANFKSQFNALPDSNLKQAIALSKTRTTANTDFSLISDINTKVNTLYEDNKPPLAITFDSVFTDVHAMDSLWKSINDFSEKEQGFAIKNTSYATETMQYDDYLKSANEHKMKATRTNIYINEAINILKDINQLNNQ